MSLPKIAIQTFTTSVPSTCQTIEFRPFLVKEEKVLLTAKESGERVDLVKAMCSIINACVQEEDFDIETHPVFDLEYIFLQIRSHSVNNIIEVVVKDQETDEDIELKINLNDVEIQNKDNETTIMLDDSMGVKMKYPTPKMADRIKAATSVTGVLDVLMMECIDSVFDDENVYLWNDNTEQEKRDFLDGLSINSYEKMKAFFNSMPRIHYRTTYKNGNGKEIVVEFSTLEDFFTWD